MLQARGHHVEGDVADGVEGEVGRMAFQIAYTGAGIANRGPLLRNVSMAADIMFQSAVTLGNAAV